jgi:hypothetical protein
MGDLCNGGDNVGTGLRGAYYSSDAPSSQPTLVRVDSRIDASRLRDWPSNLHKPPASVRWCGWIRPTVSGEYGFQANTSAMRIEIGKSAAAGPGVGVGEKISLEAGKLYSILVEIHVDQQPGDFTLQWTPPFGVTYAVPPTVLFPPIETVTPGC